MSDKADLTDELASPLQSGVMPLITINKEKNCFVQNGKEYPPTRYNVNIYQKYLEGYKNVGELSTVILEM